MALIFAVTLLAGAQAQAQSFGINVSSLVGSSGEDEVTATEIQSDGTILVGGTFASAPDVGDAETIGLASDDDSGYVLVLSADGVTVERVLRVGASVQDMAVDGEDRVFIAAGSSGMVQLDANLDWRTTKTVGDVYRVDADAGNVVTLAPSNTDDPHQLPGSGTITLLDAESGAEQVSFEGHRNTLDVCLAGGSQRIILIGWRSDIIDDLPVQVAYLRAYTYSGFVSWTDYDWGTEEGVEGYLNAPGDNGDSTRGYRCSIGADGMLYAGFEADGPNHLFRFEPDDVESPVDIVGGDEFHEFSNVRNEEKVFFGRYDPIDGSYLLGQQLVARVGNQSGNTVRMRRGAIEADAEGKVYIAGESAFGMPIQYLPPDTGDYTGGAFLLSMNSDFSERRYVTRMTPDGAAYDVAASPAVGDSGIVVYGGIHEIGDGQFYQSSPYQDVAGGDSDGFVTVFGEGIDDPNAGGVGGGSGGGGDDEGCGCASTRAHPGSQLLLVLGLLGVLGCSRRIRRR